MLIIMGVSNHFYHSRTSLKFGGFRDWNLRLRHTLFCHDIKICRDLRTFWKTWGKKCFFWDNKSVSWWKKCTDTCFFFACYTELNVQICNYVYKQRICREKRKIRAWRKFCGQFCLRRKAANFCHPAIYQMCINNHITKHQCSIFGHSAFTFSKMIFWKLSCCLIVWTQIHVQTHTHVGDGASPHTRLSS